jgi:hypothetical protein
MLIKQNYEKVKQAMLAGQDPAKAIYVSKLTDNAGRAQSSSLSNFMTNVQANSTQNKKRNIDELAKGRFRFKFQEGHSKNFKRELDFEWFLSPPSK